MHFLSQVHPPPSFCCSQCAHGWLVDCDSQLIIAHRDMQPLSSWWSDNCSNVVWYVIRGLGDDVATCGLHPVPTEGPCCESQQYPSSMIWLLMNSWQLTASPKKEESSDYASVLPPCTSVPWPSTHRSTKVSLHSCGCRCVFPGKLFF